MTKKLNIVRLFIVLSRSDPTGLQVPPTSYIGRVAELRGGIFEIRETPRTTDSTHPIHEGTEFWVNKTSGKAIID